MPQGIGPDVPFRTQFASLFTQDAAIAAGVFALVVITMGGAMLLSRRRRRRGKGPSPKAEADRLELTMRAQLAQPSQRILGPQEYPQFMSMHGTGMIAATITPLALGLGVYLIPLQVGAPRIAAPRATLLGC